MDLNGNEATGSDTIQAALEASLAPDEAAAEGTPLAAYCAPLWDKIIVQTDAEKEMEGGIHIPDAHKEAPVVATVLRVGEGRLLPDGMVCPPRVQVGDRIMFGRYAGIKIPEDFGRRVMVLREDEVLWVFPRPRPAPVPEAA